MTKDGGWGEFGPYGPCSRQCGEGLKVRRRYCDSPAPENGGLDCPPPASEAALCSGTDCTNGMYVYGFSKSAMAYLVV